MIGYYLTARRFADVPILHINYGAGMKITVTLLQVLPFPLPCTPLTSRACFPFPFPFLVPATQATIEQN